MKLDLQRVHTARLVCERIEQDHEQELGLLLRHPCVSRTLWPELAPPTERDVAASVERSLHHWAHYGFGMWLLRDCETGEMVGRGGLQHTQVEGQDHVEVGWAIVPSRWRQGLATELALRSVEIGFNSLGVEELIVLALPDNLASRRVAEKAGFSYHRAVTYAGLPHVLYTLGRPQAAGRS